MPTPETSRTRAVRDPESIKRTLLDRVALWFDQTIAGGRAIDYSVVAKMEVEVEIRDDSYGEALVYVSFRETREEDML